MILSNTQTIDSFTGEYGFLSNFHPGWTDEDPSLEHHYQAAKTDDPEWVARILDAPTPGKAKKLGQQCPVRGGWDDQKYLVMKTLLRVKFWGTPYEEGLLSTGDAVLIEGNDWGDTYWGVCKGVGLNNLGHLLMETRTAIRVSEEATKRKIQEALEGGQYT